MELVRRGSLLRGTSKEYWTVGEIFVVVFPKMLQPNQLQRGDSPKTPPAEEQAIVESLLTEEWSYTLVKNVAVFLGLIVETVLT